MFYFKQKIKEKEKFENIEKLRMERELMEEVKYK